MATNADTNVAVTLKNVRCDYISGLFEARTVQGSNTPRYSFSVILDRDSAEFRKFSEAVVKSVKAVFPTDYEKKLKEWKNNSMRCCFMDGDVKNSDRYPENTIVISANRNQAQGRIAVVDKMLQPLTADDGVIYPGCRVNVTVNLWTQNAAGQIGIRAQAVNMQFVGDGEPLSGGGNATTQGLEVISDAPEENFDGGAKAVI